jgi:arsenate reductase
LPKRVLFLCIGNACRSPMAEALARHLAPDLIAASSAGLYPLGYIAAPTLAVLAENGVGSEGQTSKPMREDDLRAADLVVNMTGRAAKYLFDDRMLPVEDWDVGDPFGSDLEVYRKIRDEIERRITDLAARLRAADAAAAATSGRAPDSAPLVSEIASEKASEKTSGKACGNEGA